MKIQLPEHFEYHERGIFAKVEDGTLEMTPNDFEKVMYELTFRLKGKRRCCYCHKLLKPGDISLDHVFPRDFGGVSIPNNLRPCCKKCNVAKNNFLPWQYKKLQQVRKSEKPGWVDYYQSKNLEERRKRGILIPEQWYEMRKSYAVFSLITSERPLKASKKYQRIQEMYEMYGKICKPIVVSQNRFVLDGFTSLLVAKNLELEIPLPFITLENVIAI